jgi:hypothetical protein
MKLHEALRHAQLDGCIDSSGIEASLTLTPLELHLLGSSKLLSIHQQALTEAAQAVARQHEIATAAGVFFSWCCSVINEEFRDQGLEKDNERHTHTHSRRPGLEPSAVLQSLSGLPDCGSKASQSLLQHLDQQLQQAMEDAGPRLSAARNGERT